MTTRWVPTRLCRLPTFDLPVGRINHLVDETGAPSVQVATEALLRVEVELLGAMACGAVRQRVRQRHRLRL